MIALLFFVLELDRRSHYIGRTSSWNEAEKP